MKNIKKLLSLLLCGIMLFGMFPASLFAAGGDTGDGSGTISETFVPEITWKRTFEYEHRHNDTEHQYTNLGGLYAGDKTAYLSTESETENNVTTYKNKVQWSWAAFSEHFNGRTDDVDDSEHKVWDYGHTDVQYADPVTDSITNPINSTKTIGSVGIIPYAPSASEQAIFAATWNNRAAQDFEASSVDGTDIYYGGYVSVKQGQMDIGYGKKSSDSTISTFSGKSFTARRFSGSFVWPKGYTLSDSIELISKNDSYYQEIYNAINANESLKAAFGGKRVVAINDDMFVFVYKDGEQLTEDNYRDYLAFFAGTAGKGVWSWPDASPQDTNHGGSGVGWGGEWNVTEPATYGDKYASKAFYKVLPNLDTAGAVRSKLSETLIGKEATDDTPATAGMMALSDYWYSFMDGNAISTVLNNKYGTTGGINAGDTVHIDIYCIDMDKAGGMDELEIRLTRQKPTTSSVTVRYWLNAVGETTDGNYLGSTTMTGQEIGSLITLANGTDVNQLNHKRAAAITKNNGGDVSDGSQQAPVPFTVKENSEENIIDVVYLPAGAQIVHFYAGNKTYAYTGQSFMVSDVTIKQGSYADIVVADSVNTKTQQLNEPTQYWQQANYAKRFTATETQTLPGIYPVPFSQTPIIVKYPNSDQHLTNYKVYTHPGSLTITYAPSAKVFTYDFGVQNSYSELLNDVEKNAEEIKVLDSSKTYVSYDKFTNALLYTPQSVNSGETIDLALVFAGGYQVKKSITFLPATNVLYEENFMTNRGGTTGEWKAEGTNNTATVVNDNENSVYGYADAYKGFAYYSNGGALKATLDLKGGKRAYTTDAVEFSFSGTGFDIISECGTDTGLLLVALSKGGNPFKVYIVDTYFCGDNSIGGNPIITGEGILDYQVPVVRALNLEHADYSVRILGYLTNTAGAIVGPASPTPWDGGETGAEDSTRGANGIDTNRILREAGLKEFIGCEVETSFMDENSVLNGGTGIAAKNSQNRTFGKRDTAAQAANVYLDAFRIYKPLADETKYIENEQRLKYAPVYDYVKNSANSIGSEILPNSMVYVEYDGDTEIAHIANYQERGPQNEVYLTNGNYIGFALEGYTEGKTVMISAKAVAGDPVLGYLDTDTNAEVVVTPSGMKMTEMYYDVTDCVRQYGAKYMLVLGNIAEAGTRTGTRSILSVSGIKLADGIIPATSTQIAADIASLVTLAYQPVEEPVFTPERFELRYSGRALAGWFTRISVKTSTDVDHVSVYRLADDGSLVPVRENMRPMNSLFTYFGWMDYYAFSLTVRAPRRGMTDTYYIFAYDANGVASEPAIASITGR